MTSDLDHLHDYFLSLGFAAQPSTYRKAATVTSTQRAYRTPPFPAEAHSRRPASGCPPTEGAFGGGGLLRWALVPACHPNPCVPLLLLLELLNQTADQANQGFEVPCVGRAFRITGHQLARSRTTPRPELLTRFVLLIKDTLASGKRATQAPPPA